MKPTPEEMLTFCQKKLEETQQTDKDSVRYWKSKIHKYEREAKREDNHNRVTG